MRAAAAKSASDGAGAGAGADTTPKVSINVPTLLQANNSANTDPLSSVLAHHTETLGGCFNDEQTDAQKILELTRQQMKLAAEQRQNPPPHKGNPA